VSTGRSTSYSMEPGAWPIHRLPFSVSLAQRRRRTARRAVTACAATEGANAMDRPRTGLPSSTTSSVPCSTDQSLANLVVQGSSHHADRGRVGARGPVRSDLAAPGAVARRRGSGLLMDHTIPWAGRPSSWLTASRIAPGVERQRMSRVIRWIAKRSASSRSANSCECTCVEQRFRQGADGFGEGGVRWAVQDRDHVMSPGSSSRVVKLPSIHCSSIGMR